MTKERLNMSTENNENNNRQEPKRVRQLLLMLILSWIALISVTVQYVRYRQQVVQQTEGRLSGEDPELTALQSDYQKAMEIMGTEQKNTVFIGDQLFTDVYGAKRTGIRNILVRPIHPKEEIQIVFKRKLEKIVLYFYQKEQRKRKNS